MPDGNHNLRAAQIYETLKKPINGAPVLNAALDARIRTRRIVHRQEGRATYCIEREAVSLEVVTAEEELWKVVTHGNFGVI